jgi:hypothetical protein
MNDAAARLPSAAMGRSNRVGFVLGAATLAVFVACKGGSGSSAAPAESSDPPAATSTAKKLIKCGDFFSRAEVAALGFDAKSFDENAEQQNPGYNVMCQIGDVLAAIAGGSAYETSVDGADEAVKKGIIKNAEGPTLGSASHWTEMKPMSTLAFRSTSKKYAATVTASDKAMVEKVARALDAKMN